MYVAFYRWRLKSGREREFAELWAAGTALFVSEQGSLGSRLHCAEDGTWFAYAQWPSRAASHAPRTLSPAHAEGLARMGDCVSEAFPVILGEVARDLLAPPAKENA